MIDREKNFKKWLADAKKIHGDKYDYSKVKYINARTKVCIVCPIHGEFWQTPYDHLNGGCLKCYNDKRGEKTRKKTDFFVKESISIHGNKYIYDKTEYKNNHTRVCITCPEHGEFWQIPYVHLSGCGCPKCAGKFKTKEDFIKDAQKIHGDKYDYSKTVLSKMHEKTIFICRKHGEFLQSPSNHLQGQGCPMCTSNSKLENELRNFLTKENISFIEKANKSTFKWLDRLHLDFYLPDYNIAIECQGKQHFGIGGWSKHFNVEKQILRDSRKRDLCKENNLILLYYSNLNIEYPYEVFTNKNNLLKEIKKYEK